MAGQEPLFAAPGPTLTVGRAVPAAPATGAYTPQRAAFPEVVPCSNRNCRRGPGGKPMLIVPRAMPGGKVKRFCCRPCKDAAQSTDRLTRIEDGHRRLEAAVLQQIAYLHSLGRAQSLSPEIRDGRLV